MQLIIEFLNAMTAASILVLALFVLDRVYKYFKHLIKHD